MSSIPIGIYEKALRSKLDWQQRLELAAALGFDFVEISIDESDERLSRLEWDTAQKRDLREATISTHIPVLDMCLSAHRKYALGSADPTTRAKALEIFHKAIEFAGEIGIRIIQLAGYYVYYERKTLQTVDRYKQGLEEGLRHASRPV
jgi:L-ribulose-5-phosphate 3-epimerase UlaE